MRSRSAALGAALATTTAVAWGGQFVVGKSALERVDAFPLSTIRYAIAVVVWIGVLAAFEGRRSLLLDGRGLRLFWLGTLGFAGFNLLAYSGLAHARPESAALIVALAPLLTALVLWHRTGKRPSATTFALLGVALAGVALVVSRGHPSAIVDGAIGYGDLLVFGGVLSFVFYGLGAAQFPDYSALRYTTLTAMLGWISMALATAVALAAGWVPMPTSANVWDITPQIAYLALPGAVIAVLAWNEAIRLIGAQNTFLFGNLIPVTTFTIEIVRGYRPSVAEVAGAALTIGALVANNLLARREANRPRDRNRQSARPVLDG
jgi:drug/metabolite transporter (DMT)-like permease